MKLTITVDEIRAYIIKKISDDDVLKKLTNANSHSVWMLIVSAVAKAYAYFFNPIIQYVYNSIFAKSSDRYSLSRHMEDEGLVLKSSDYATVQVRIGSKKRPTSEIQIPQGYIVKTPDTVAKCFEITDGGAIDSSTPLDDNGYYTGLFLTKAVGKGSSYNVLSGTITELESSIDGIDVIYNPLDASGGADDEALESGYARLVNAKIAKARGTKTWYKSEAEKIPGVKQAIAVPRYEGRGTIGILIVGYGGPAAQEVLDAVSGTFNTDENDPAGAAHVIATRPKELVQDFTITVWYNRENGAPSDSDLFDVVDSYIRNLDPGEDQILRVIEAELIKYGMKDARISSPSANVTVPADMISKTGIITWIKEVWIDA